MGGGYEIGDIYRHVPSDSFVMLTKNGWVYICRPGGYTGHGAGEGWYPRSTEGWEPVSVMSIQIQVTTVKIIKVIP